MIPDQGAGERWPMMNRTAPRPRLHAARARLARLPEAVWAPLAGAALMALPAAVGLVMGKPWLFPSLGPTVFVHVTTPRSPGARLYNTLVGHLLGIVAAAAAVAVLGAAAEPSVMGSGHLLWRRAWASVLAVALTLLSQELLKAQHAPAAATTMLVTLGGFRADWSDVATITVGVLLVALPGELARRARIPSSRGP
ncbi:HPP family protein [Sorangium sp. So ce281]|uniref:HPP family protein n=1 Tax=Sorangium sp. So ce281 TaxID=3133293 RepID=UPI003F5D982D